MGITVVPSNIKSIAGSSDIHSMLGTAPLKAKEYSPDNVRDGGSTGGEDEDYEPDYVGDNGVLATSKGSWGQIYEDNDITKTASYSEWILEYNNNDSLGDDDLYPTKNFHIINVEPKQKVRIIQHPIESGTVRMDNRVRDPIHVTIVGQIEKKDAPGINSMLQDASDDRLNSMKHTFNIISPLGYDYENLWLVDYSKKASNEKIDVFEYRLELQEVLIAQSQTDITDNAAHASMVHKGGQGS